MTFPLYLFAFSQRELSADVLTQINNQQRAIRFKLLSTADVAPHTPISQPGISVSDRLKDRG
jgi:hypothetical protein